MDISIQRYEKLYIKVFCLIISFLFLEILFFKGTPSIINKDLKILKACFLSFLLIFFIYKAIFIFFRNFDFEKYFYFFRISELLLIVSFCLFFDTKVWLYILLAFPIIITSISKGIKPALAMLLYVFTLNIFTFTIYKLVFLEMAPYEVRVKMTDFLIIYLIIVLLAFISKKTLNSFNIRDDLTKENEIQETYSKLKETNATLEHSNMILAETNAELYTMQYIVRKINLIMNLKELANCVDDIILGIMGATNVSFILFERGKNKFKLFTSTISKMDRSIVADNLDSTMLLEFMESQSLCCDNFVSNDKYSFVGERQVGSIMLVPLVSGTKQLGLIMIEHKMQDYFDEAKLNFMNVVAQQVVIAFEKAELYNRLHELAVLDGLTGIYNRVYFQKKLADEIENAKKTNGMVSLVIFDIDHFKSFNDNYGHMFGDMVLKHIVTLVKSHLRKGDTIARFGGEEFVIIMPNLHIHETKSRIEMIRDNLENTKLVEGNSNYSVTASFGIACYPDGGRTGDDLIRSADVALYEAKKAGRNCVKLAFE